MTLATFLQFSSGAAFLVSGAVAWRCRPSSRVGPFMVLFGVMRFGGTALTRLDEPAAITLGILLGDGAVAALFLVLLTFPDGRLHRRDWLILGPVVVAVGPLEVVWLLFFPLAEAPGANLLLAWPSQVTADVVDAAQRLLCAGAEIALAAVLAVRWRRASPPLRRTLLPALVGAAALLVGSLEILHQRFVGPTPAWLMWVLLVTLVGMPLALLASILQARLARASVGELFLDLRTRRERHELRDALARALGDPTLELAYWLPEFGRYANVGGEPVDLAPDGDGRATTLVERAGRPVAALVHDASLAHQPARLEEVAAAAGIALENARLDAELQARVTELRGSRARVIEAADTERRRLERNLHDGAQGRLVAVSLELRRLEARVGSDPEAQRLVAGVRQELADSLSELRELARGIHPAVLADHGLAIALEGLVARSAVPTTLRVDLPGRLAEPAEVAAYYLVSEALANTDKYAAASAASVEVREHGGRVVVEVTDDGIGGADTANGSGLRGLADRFEALDGTLRVWSPPGDGTRVRAEIPCAS